MAKSENSMTHQWDDPLFLNSQLSEDERMIRDMARNYCQDKLLPRVITANREERFDREIFDEIVDSHVQRLIHNEAHRSVVAMIT